MLDKASRRHYTTIHKPYVEEAYYKTLPTKEYILPYILDKDVIDWGSGPGHRAKFLLAWGAKSVRCYDPNQWCRYIFDTYYASNQLTWLDDLDNLQADTLYMADMAGHAGDNPIDWIKYIYKTTNCKHLVATWDKEVVGSVKQQQRLLHHDITSWCHFNVGGYNNKVLAYDMYTENKTVEPILYKEIPLEGLRWSTTCKILIREIHNA